MSKSSFDSVSTTLQNLKDIVDRNHAHAEETSLLVQDMERLVDEMKSKAREQKLLGKFIEPPTIVMPPTGMIQATT